MAWSSGACVHAQDAALAVARCMQCKPTGAVLQVRTLSHVDRLAKGPWLPAMATCQMAGLQWVLLHALSCYGAGAHQQVCS